jgi:hypothetical protein
MPMETRIEHQRDSRKSEQADVEICMPSQTKNQCNAKELKISDRQEIGIDRYEWKTEIERNERNQCMQKKIETNERQS